MKRVAFAVFFVAIGCLVATSVSNVSSVAKVQSEKDPPGADFGGRYKIIVSDGGNFSRAGTWLLDTSTGRTWREIRVFDLAGQPDVWGAENRFDDLASFQQWYAGLAKVEKNGVANPLAAPNANK